MQQDKSARYYLQVVSSGEEPEWPEDESELVIGQKSLGRSFTQFWAYPQNEGKTAEEEPHAEAIASKNPTDYPAILIDEPYGTYDRLELILVNDGHAWAKTESNLFNLEENINSTLDYAHNKLNINVEHFMTTDRVSPEVEAKLDELEDNNSTKDRQSIKPKMEDPISSPQDIVIKSPQTRKGFSKVAVIVPIIFLFVAFGGVIFFRDQIIAKFSSFQKPASEAPAATPTITPSPTPTPIPIDRSKFKVRVLNGTTKTGAASTLADKLKELGWIIDKVGNNNNQSVPQTQVRVKSNVESSVSATLIADLAPDLKATASAELKSTDKVDMEVVIGKE